MNKIELFIYNRVKNSPEIKRKLVGIYQGILSCIPQSNFKCNYKNKVHNGFYYGFHDKSPFSEDGDKLLVHKIITPIKSLKGGEKIEIGFIDKSGFGNYKKIASTDAWNWQMASMLQWFGRNNNSLIAFNTIERNKHCSVVQNLNGETKYKFEKPIVHLSHDGGLAISYDFLDVEKAMPGYGIKGDIQCERNKISVWKTDNQKECWSMTLDEAKSIAPHPSMVDAHHFFHHALFSPDGSKLFFLHRWLDAGARRWTRLFTVDSDGQNLKLQPMDEMVSHITWKNNTELFSYLRWPGVGDGYFLLNIKTMNAKRYLQEHLNSDGHPTYDENREIILTDTYPDRFRNQYLYIFKIKNGELKQIAKTHLPLYYTDELQIDMHPRLSPRDNKICIDGADKNGIKMTVIDFSETL